MWRGLRGVMCRVVWRDVVAWDDVTAVFSHDVACCVVWRGICRPVIFYRGKVKMDTVSDEETLEVQDQIRKNERKTDMEHINKRCSQW